MAESIHRQLDAARDQLDDAIALFYSERYYSATTLAGASNGIAGKMVEDRRGKDSHALGSITTAVQALSPGDSRKQTNRMINEVRDWLKHRQAQEFELRFDAQEAAREMIDRAITDYFDASDGHETEAMARFRRDHLKPSPPMPRE